MKYSEQIYSLWIKVFGLKKEEEPKFKQLFFHSFFLWWFISFYFVAANGVFISYFSSEYLPFAYVGAGLMGYLVTLLYSFFQKYIKPKYLFLSAIGIMIVLTILSRISMYFMNEELTKWLAFFVFIWAWPFISLVNIESGGLAIQFLDLRQVKRQFGMISIGGIISSILSYFVIPLMMPFLSHPFDLLYVGVLGLLAGMYIIFNIYRKFQVETPASRRAEIKEKPTGTIFQLIKERYFLYIFLSAVLSMMTIYFTDFQYLSSIRIQDKLIQSAADAANFISLMAGIVKTGEFLLSYFSNRILGRYGMRLGLSVMPWGLLILVSLASVAGLIWDASSIVFFIVIVVTKAAERILRRGLDDPSFNILYQPLPGKQKLEVQTKVGVVMQISIGIAGVFLYLISQILTTEKGFLLKYYPLFYLPLLIAWVIVSWKLFGSYKDTLKQILSEVSKKFRRDPDQHKYGEELLIRKFKHDNNKVIRFSVNMLAETNPAAMDRFASTLLELRDENITRTILNTVDPTAPKRLANSIIKEGKSENYPPKLVPLTTRAIEIMQIDYQKEKDIAKLQEYCISGDFMLQMKAVKILSGENIEEEEKYIQILLQSKHRRVVKSALRLAGKINSGELNKIVATYIENPAHSHTVVAVLTESNKDTFSTLEKIFSKKNIDTRVQLRIIEIYGKVGTAKAKEILIKHLNYPNKEIQEGVIRALNFCRFQVEPEQREVIIEKIKETVARILYLKVVIEQAEEAKYTFKLIQSLELERDSSYDLLFNLLGFIYKSSTISIIKKNVLGANTIFALELIDNFLDQDIKQIIVPLFDNFALSQKIKQLHDFVHIKKLNFADRLKELIISDYFVVNTWTRTKVIELLGKTHKNKVAQKQVVTKTNKMNDIEIWQKKDVQELLESIRKSEMPDEIFACLHHSHALIFTTAAQIIYNENPARAYEYLQRLSPKKKSILGLLEGSDKSGETIITEKIKYLRRNPLFFTIPEYSLVKLAEIFNVALLKKDEKFSLINEQSEFIAIVLRGEVLDTLTDEIYKKEDFIARGMSVSLDTNDIVSVKNSTLLYANRFDYFNLLLDEVEILNQMFDMLDSQQEIGKQSPISDGEDSD